MHNTPQACYVKGGEAMKPVIKALVVGILSVLISVITDDAEPG